MFLNVLDNIMFVVFVANTCYFMAFNNGRKNNNVGLVCEIARDINVRV